MITVSVGCCTEMIKTQYFYMVIMPMNPRIIEMNVQHQIWARIQL